MTGLTRYSGNNAIPVAIGLGCVVTANANVPTFHGTLSHQFGDLFRARIAVQLFKSLKVRRLFPDCDFTRMTLGTRFRCDNQVWVALGRLSVCGRSHANAEGHAREQGWNIVRKSKHQFQLPPEVLPCKAGSILLRIQFDLAPRTEPGLSVTVFDRYRSCLIGSRNRSRSPALQ